MKKEKALKLLERLQDYCGENLNWLAYDFAQDHIISLVELISDDDHKKKDEHD